MTPDEVKAMFAENPTREEVARRRGCSERYVTNIMTRLRKRGYKIVTYFDGVCYRYDLLKG